MTLYFQSEVKEMVDLLKNQGFYRRKYKNQKLTEKQEQAPKIKWKYSIYEKDEL